MRITQVSLTLLLFSCLIVHMYVYIYTYREVYPSGRPSLCQAGEVRKWSHSVLLHDHKEQGSFPTPRKRFPTRAFNAYRISCYKGSTHRIEQEKESSEYDKHNRKVRARKAQEERLYKPGDGEDVVTRLSLSRRRDKDYVECCWQ